MGKTERSFLFCYGTVVCNGQNKCSIENYMTKKINQEYIDMNNKTVYTIK